MIESRVQKLDRAFNPKTVAVVGDKKASGYMWLNSLLAFQGKLYSVQVDPNELPGIAALGVPNYLSLLDIPEPVDYVVVAVPRAVAPRIARDCIRKGVGGATFFTSGFAETKTDEGIKLQLAITEMARESGFNVIGPNCMGIYNPKIGVRHSPDQPYGEAGSVGFIAQSGTHATFFSVVGARHGINISKSVSYGNAVVLDSTDYLEYLGQDEETKIIGLYIEGVKDGRRFLRCLQEVARKKLVLIWKGGQTAAGARATASHTGVLAESSTVWEALIRQCGAIKVDSLDEMIDTVVALLYIKPATGSRVGLIAMSGGQSVVITDAFAKAGLEVPLLTEESYQRLASFFITIGGSYNNPFDISSNFLGVENPLPSLQSMLDVMDKDKNIDCIVLEISSMLVRRNPQALGSVLDAVSDFKKVTGKPFLTILTMAQREEQAPEIRERLVERGIPSFPNFERGAKALKRIVDYYRSRQDEDKTKER